MEALKEHGREESLQSVVGGTSVMENLTMEGSFQQGL